MESHGVKDLAFIYGQRNFRNGKSIVDNMDHYQIDRMNKNRD